MLNWIMDFFEYIGFGGYLAIGAILGGFAAYVYVTFNLEDWDRVDEYDILYAAGIFLIGLLAWPLALTATALHEGTLGAAKWVADQINRRTGKLHSKSTRQRQ